MNLEMRDGFDGTTPADLTAQLQQSESLAQLAQAKGVTEQALTDTILQPFKDRLALQVKHGYLTQEQAEARILSQQTRAKQLISAVTGSNGDNTYGWCHGGGFGGPGGMMGPGGRGMMGWW